MLIYLLISTVIATTWSNSQSKNQAFTRVEVSFSGESSTNIQAIQYGPISQSTYLLYYNIKIIPV